MVKLLIRTGNQVTVFGNRSTGPEDAIDTPNGTRIRDYVQIADLCAAHLFAMDRLCDGGSSRFEPFNLRTGTEYSVKEVIETCRSVTGPDIRYRISGGRLGDPARLVTGAARAREELGWSPEFNELAAIVETAWRWFSRQPVRVSG